MLVQHERIPLRTHDGIVRAIQAARHAQQQWATQALRDRARIASKVAGCIAQEAHELATALESPYRRDHKESCSAELLPLADASRWLSKQGWKSLLPERASKRGLPLWLGKIDSTVIREPMGIVLIVATWNYPLFLMGVQVLQALVAGNGVAIKAAPGCMAITQIWISILERCGFPKELIVLLDEEVESFDHAIEVGVDLVVMTGGSATGRKIQAKLASKLIPSILELGGSDSMWVLSSANLDRVAQAIRFSLELNSSATCVATRRVFIERSIYSRAIEAIRTELASFRPGFVSGRSLQLVWSWVDDAVSQGAKLLFDLPRQEPAVPVDCGTSIAQPIVLYDVTSSMKIVSQDCFAPWVLLIPVENIEEAISIDRASEYALGASVFGDERTAQSLALRHRAGSIVINDVIVPMADPRLPFGGSGQSGFGSTRGREGLLAMTRPKVLSTRKGNWLPHLEKPKEHDEAILFGMLTCLHGGSWSRRIQGMKEIFLAVWRGK